MQNLAELFKKRIIFVEGKGGVGKTTISVALAIAASLMDKRVLIVEIGQTDSVGQLLRVDSLCLDPKQIMPNIWGICVDPKNELVEYIFAHIGVNYIAKKVTKSRLFDHLTKATPGLKEIMTLGQIWRKEQELENDKYRYDLIIVDAPATGHGFSLLKVPQTLIEMIRFGPISEQLSFVKDMLKDEKKTMLSIVTLPEELPVNETKEFIDATKNDLSMDVKLTFINCVYPKIFSKDDILKINDLKNKQDDPFINELLESSKQQFMRRNMQKKYIKQINESTNGNTVNVPFYYTNDITINEIGKIATMFVKLANKKYV